MLSPAGWTRMEALARCGLVACAVAGCPADHAATTAPQSAAADSGSAPSDAPDGAGDAGDAAPDSAVDSPDTGPGPDDVAADGVAATLVSLIDNTLWTPVAESADPFWPADPGAQAALALCPEATFGPETARDGIWFDVITRECTYLTVGQPLLADVPAGAVIRVRIWHFAIFTGEGGFHLALAAGPAPTVIFEADVPVPSESGLLYQELPAPRAFAAGEPVLWHIRNHGDNAWALIEVTAVRE